MELAIEPKVKGICYQKSDNCARRGKVVVWLVRGASVLESVGLRGFQNFDPSLTLLPRKFPKFKLFLLYLRRYSHCKGLLNIECWYVRTSWYFTR